MGKKSPESIWPTYTSREYCETIYRHGCFISHASWDSVLNAQLRKCTKYYFICRSSLPFNTLKIKQSWSVINRYIRRVVFYASAFFRRRRHYVFGLYVRLSVRSPTYPLSTCTWVRPSDQPWSFYGMTVRPSVWRVFRAFAGERMEGMAWNFVW